MGEPEPIKQPPLPRKVSFPFGYTVRFKYLKPADMPASSIADWEEETRIVRINRERSYEQKLEDIKHELGHCYVDWVRHVEKILGRT